MNKLIEKFEDMDELAGDYEILETGEIVDIADIRFGYDGQVLTLKAIV